MRVFFWISLLLPAQAFLTPRASRVCSQLHAFEYALLFDCDGVILETEELHRQAYNAAFQEFQLTAADGSQIEWTVEYYDVLQNSIGGGKPKMRHSWAKEFPIVSGQVVSDQEELIDRVQDFKTDYFKTIVKSQAKPRPGVLDLMDQALKDPTIAVGVCSASTKEAAIQTLDVTLGPERVRQLDVCILGDDVKQKKPDPMIYNTARERLSLEPHQCVVIEDSVVGLRAARAANMKCIITYTSSTQDSDFYGEGAIAKIPNLAQVTLDQIFDPIRSGNEQEILATIREVDTVKR